MQNKIGKHKSKLNKNHGKKKNKEKLKKLLLEVLNLK